MSNSDVVIVEDDDLMGSVGKNWWILLALGAVMILGIWAVVNTASAGKLQRSSSSSGSSCPASSASFGALLLD